MIPYAYNMVDMGGIDLAEANGTVVEGLYSKIIEAVNDCGDVVLYNWKFASIEIAPQHTQILLGEDALIINGAIQVTELDQVSIIGIEPPPSPVIPLTATENRQYNPEPPAVGFSPVTVAVPIPSSPVIPLTATENRQYNPEPPAVGFSPVTVAVPIPPAPIIVNISIDENGTYNPQDYDADGFGVVSVNVSSGSTNIEAVRVWTNSAGAYDASLYVQEGYVNGYEFTPTAQAVLVLYNTVQQTPREFNLISIAYVNNWKVTAKDDLTYNYTSLLTGNYITWNYSRSINYVFVLKGE